MSGKSRSLKKIFVSLSLVFGCVAAPPLVAAEPEAAPLPPPAPAVTGEGLWKTEYFNSVVSVQKCQGDKVCASFYWLDPADKRIYDTFADPADKDKKRRSREDVGEKDILSLCGFSPQTDIRTTGPGVWEGTVDVRGMGITADVSITMLNDNQADVVGSKFILSHEEIWQRVQPGDPRYPQCKKPGP